MRAVPEDYTPGALNFFPSFLHIIPITLRPDCAEGGRPPPGSTHWPAMKKLSNPGRVFGIPLPNDIFIVSFENSQPSMEPFQLPVYLSVVRGVATSTTSTSFAKPFHLLSRILITVSAIRFFSLLYAPLSAESFFQYS